MATEQPLIKRFLPRSLLGRALLILVLPIVLLQAVLTLVIIQRHYDRVTAQMSAAVADEIAYAIELAENPPGGRVGAEAALARLSASLDLDFRLQEGPPVNPGVWRDWYDLTGRVIARELLHQIDRPLSVVLDEQDKAVEARIETRAGVLRTLVPRRRLNASNPHQLLLWMVVAAVPLTLVAVLFLRNQIRPIRQLAQAAAAFGRGRHIPFRPSGAEEVRRAGHAFLDMRSRIERHIEQRTLMLSGVSHDLRTPLTRLKLALAMSDGPEAADMARDVAEMERMVEGFLAFARGEDGEASAPTDPVALAEEVVADAARRGTTVMLATPAEAAPAMELRRSAMKRCLENLVGNAAAHGSRVQLTVRLRRRALDYVVEDDGPGIPPDQREAMLRPFARMDAARNQDLRPGIGLGLTIALDAARSHGGSLTLDDSPALGGLRATVTIPR